MEEGKYMRAVHPVLELEGGESLDVDAHDVFDYDPDLYGKMMRYPLEVLAIFDIVLMDLVARIDPLFEKHIQNRIYNLKSSISTMNRNPSDIEKIVSIKGIIIRCSSIILEVKENIVQDAMDFPTLTAYISYARKHFNPILSDEAAEELTSGYVEMRKRGNSPGSRTIDMDLIMTGISASERIRRANQVAAARNLVMDRMQIGGSPTRVVELLEELRKQSSMEIHLHDLKNALTTVMSEGRMVVLIGDSVKRI